MISTVSSEVLRTMSELVHVVEAFQLYQSPDGSVRLEKRQRRGAETLLRRTTSIARRIAQLTSQPSLVHAITEDTNEWIRKGLDTPPDYSITQKEYRTPVHGSLSFLLAPQRTPNGPNPQGCALQCFLALSQTPDECTTLALELGIDHPNCAYTRLLVGSSGYRLGNCVVTFSENIASRRSVATQMAACFHMNKFHQIYRQETLPRILRVFGPLNCHHKPWKTRHLTASQCYSARCIWAFLHEYYHQQGPRPLRDNLGLKMKWNLGVLEELKVDAKVVLHACRNNVPFAEQIKEFVLMDRMLRYPNQRNANSDFDAATGLFLFEWLRRDNVLTKRRRLVLRDHMLPDSLERLTATIERLETLDERSYIHEATALVRTLLAKPSASSDRFAFSERYLSEVGYVPRKDPIDCGDLDY